MIEPYSAVALQTPHHNCQTPQDWDKNIETICEAMMQPSGWRLCNIRSSWSLWGRRPFRPLPIPGWALTMPLPQTNGSTSSPVRNWTGFARRRKSTGPSLPASVGLEIPSSTPTATLTSPLSSTRRAKSSIAITRIRSIGTSIPRRPMTSGTVSRSATDPI